MFLVTIAFHFGIHPGFLAFVVQICDVRPVLSAEVLPLPGDPMLLLLIANTTPLRDEIRVAGRTYLLQTVESNNLEDVRESRN